ncbi:hypothetical protein [Carboxylicivirga taeanensis]|uniref:hypothetical protein n=1 Tax=Carboxylicivirga taeanensis TaxID=1416875 RepID=UPI003F6E3D4E
MKQLCTIYPKAGLLIAGLLLHCTLVVAQYPVSGEILEVGGDYSDVRVELRSNRQQSSIPISANGMFFASLDWNTTYTFSFFKEGYVSKVIEFATHLPQGVSASNIEPYHMPVRLFKMFDGVDTVFFKNPVAKIRYDEAKPRANGRVGDFSDDRDYSLKVKYRVEQMRQQGKRPNNVKQTVKSSNEANLPQQTAALEKEVPKRALTEDVPQATVSDPERVPPLKESYPDGEHNEKFTFKNRTVLRTIFVADNLYRVFLSVKHNWGGHYYFINETTSGYRCISKETYENSIETCRTKLTNNK